MIIYQVRSKKSHDYAGSKTSSAFLSHTDLDSSCKINIRVKDFCSIFVIVYEVNDINNFLPIKDTLGVAVVRVASVCFEEDCFDLSLILIEETQAQVKKSCFPLYSLAFLPF